MSDRKCSMGRIFMSGILRLIPLIIDWLVPKNNRIFIYGSYGSNSYSDNSRFMFEYALKKKPDARHYWITSNRKLYIKLIKRFPRNVLYAKSPRGLFTIMRARFVFISDHITDVFYILSRRHIIINLWHGIALKRIQHCIKNKYQFPSLRMPRKLIYGNRFSYIIASSETERKNLSRCFRIDPKRVLITGQPRNDIIKNSRLKKKFSFFKNYKNILLYAPTLRDKEKPTFFPFKDMDFRKLEDFLESNRILLILRGHEGNVAFDSESKSNRKMRFDDLMNIRNIVILNQDKLSDVNEIFNHIDLVITDYSSLFFEFLLTEKPVMFIPYDLKEVEHERGFLFDYESISPGPKVSTFRGFKSEIMKLLIDRNYYHNERLSVKNFLFKHQDNQARERILAIISRMS